ncbi:hypothetical protein [Acidisphaera sp. L21]|jgi:hypothetical protein|uniref:hypothetical protein n=1 Tax=Acidisphaera sp. L21 TaxID=1641851 RepID=UPI00131EB2AE|nr:hypothetical protein [Acidisphaera sp. L21]
MDTAAKPISWVLHIDDFDNGVMNGWVFDRMRPDFSVSLEISSTGGEKLTILANGFRKDLLEAKLGNGFHAFTVDVSAWDLAGNTVTVAAAGSPDVAPLLTISTSLAESLTRMPWSRQYLGILNQMAQPFAVADDAQ